MEERYFANRFHDFCVRMHWRRLQKGIREPEWIHIRDDEQFQRRDEF